MMTNQKNSRAYISSIVFLVLVAGVPALNRLTESVRAPVEQNGLAPRSDLPATSAAWEQGTYLIRLGAQFDGLVASAAQEDFRDEAMEALVGSTLTAALPSDVVVDGSIVSFGVAILHHAPANTIKSAPAGRSEELATTPGTQDEDSYMTALLQKLAAAGLAREMYSLADQLEQFSGQLDQLNQTLVDLRALVQSAPPQPSGINDVLPEGSGATVANTIRAENFPPELEPVRQAAIQRTQAQIAEMQMRIPRADIWWERNYAGQLAQAQGEPNDPWYQYQWHLRSAQSDFPFLYNIMAPQGWQIRRDTAGITVGVIDSGITWLTDLTPNLRINPRELPGNGFDDDHNGYIDDVFGFDARLNSGLNDIAPNSDDHGTIVASILGSVGNNSMQMSGVAWTTKMLNIKLGATVNLERALRSLQYARKAHLGGANLRVTNMSWTVGMPNNFGNLLCQALEDMPSGMLFVVASGNSGMVSGSAPVYAPADCLSRAGRKLRNLISVTASGYDGGFPYWAPTSRIPYTDTAAPGTGIIVPLRLPTGSYVMNEVGGTSFSAPIVSGVAALVAAYNGMSAAQIRDRILKTVRPSFPLHNNMNVPGVVNLCYALKDYECACCGRPGGVGCSENEIDEHNRKNPCVPYPTVAPTATAKPWIPPYTPTGGGPTPQPTAEPTATVTATPTQTATPTRTPTYAATATSTAAPCGTTGTSMAIVVPCTPYGR